jgi:hypothetical protein
MSRSKTAGRPAALVIEHQKDAGCPAPLQCGQNGVEPVRLQRNDDEVVGDSLIERVCDRSRCSFTRDIHDAGIALQLLQALGFGSRDGRNGMAADANHLKR